MGSFGLSVQAQMPPIERRAAILLPEYAYTYIAPDSLPFSMPLLKRVFWGHQGIFRKTGIAPKYRSTELHLRRTMLQWHQRLGLITLTGMIIQFTTGLLIYNNPAKYYQKWRPIHRTSGYVLLGLYGATASLSIFAPPARVYRPGFNSIKLHQYLALIHFPGMMLQPYLGWKAATARSAQAYDRYLNLHRTVGFITTLAFSAAVLSTFLPY